MNIFGMDPLSMLVDKGCDLLGLPPEAKGVAKLGAAFFTGDAVMGIDGASNLIGGLASGQGQQTKTEHRPPRQTAQGASGYAPEPGASAASASNPLNALGGGEGKGGFEGIMSKLADPLGLFPGVRLFDPLNLFGMLGLGGQPSPAPTPPAAPAPAPVRCTSAAGALGSTSPQTNDPGRFDAPPLLEAPTSARSGRSHLDPNIAEYRSCLKTLLQNWETYDTAVGSRDEYITRENLSAIDNNPAASAELKGAARFLLRHPEYFNRLEMAAHVGGKDGIIGKGDVLGDLHQVDSDIAKYGLPRPEQGPRPVSEAKGPNGARVREILDDPSLSLEDKIQLMLQQISDGLDKDILDTLSAQDSAKASGSGQADQVKAQKDSEQLQLKLQKLIERRKQMFDLMTNMSEKFNEMSKAAIQNMARA